ncbi:MAG: two-component regulator propeller domain-containing protein [Flavobacteriales bacterium]
MVPSHIIPVAYALLVGCGAASSSARPSPSDTGPDTTRIAQYVVHAFTDNKGTLWFGTMGHGVAHVADGRLTFHSPADGAGGDVVSSIAQDRYGDMWFAGHEGTGLVRYDGNVFSQQWSEESAVNTDRDGNVWAATAREVLRHDGEHFVPFPLPIDRAAITVYAIRPGRASLALHDSKGDFWFRTDGAGLLKYDGKDFTHYTKEDGLCSNSVNDVVEDDDGRIWVICMQAFQPGMTDDGGLCRLDGERFTGFPELHGLHHNDLYTLFKDSKGAIWVGATGTGVYRFDGTDFTLYDRTDRPDLNAGFGLQGMTEAADGTLWCGFSGGLFRFDGKGFVHVGRNGPWKR